MAKKKAGLGKTQKKRLQRKGRRRGWARDCSGSDDPSDEEFVVGLDEDCESSCDSYSSDASREASEAASCSEGEEDEEEEEEIDWEDDSEEEEEEDGEGGRPRRKRRRKSRAKRRRNSIVSVDFEGDLGPPMPRKARAAPRLVPEVLPEEEDDYDDDKDEDFAPDEDEEEEEEPAKSPQRKISKNRRRKVPIRRRNATRVSISDDEDCCFEKKGRNRGRKRRMIRSDSSESDSSGDSREILIEKIPDLNQRPTLVGNHAENKGKGKNLDKLALQICGICLSEERREIVRGVLDCCAHFFCFACIMEWSKVESRCPVCKRRFKTVTKSGFSLRMTVVRIPIRDQVYQPSEEEIMGFLDPYASVVCIECQQGGDDNLMLLCDICDSPAHTYCVGLGRDVPEGNWYCNSCRYTDPASSTPLSHGPHIDTGSRSNPLPESHHCESSLGSCSSCQLHEQIPSDGILSPPFGLETPSRPSPGVLASTLFGRRSIHQRIRIMLFNQGNRNRRNASVLVPEIDGGGDGEILVNGRDERNRRIIRESGLCSVEPVNRQS
ncbi:uncharacterized protein LOC144714681 [Wolffia australiana]